MKKLFLLMFLMMATLSFANSGKIAKPIRVNPLKAVACCTVGGFSCCGLASDPNLCTCATGKYCKAHNCAGGSPVPAN